MPDHTPHDPWDSLADTLGAKPAADSPQPHPQPTPPPRPRERPATQRPPAAAASGDWDGLADTLGIPTKDEPAARPAPPRHAVEIPRSRPAAPPVRDAGEESREAGYRSGSRQTSRDSDELPPPRKLAEASEDRPVREPRSEEEPRGEGEGRGRRRRGRRGGRSRRRDDDRPAQAETTNGRDFSDQEQDDDLRGDQPGGFEEGRPLGERDVRPARRSAEPRPRGRSRDDEPSRERGRRPRAEDDSERGPRPAAGGDLERPARDLHDSDDGVANLDRREGAEGHGPDDELPPRKRRRRGRRGGRGRDRGPNEAGERVDAVRPSTGHGDDDEPLPASYGSRSQAPRAGSADRPEESRRSSGERESTEGSGAEPAGPSRGRRRRRRGDRPRTEGTEGRKTGTSERRESSRSRSSEARGSGRSRSRSEEPRGERSRSRRDDFTPVSGRYDEDDEGLEFLGVEEAARDVAPRQRPIEDDDVLAESGLSSVLDVPSWVEAIGIVIAGNLAGRNRGGRNEGGSGKGR